MHDGGVPGAGRTVELVEQAEAEARLALAIAAGRMAVWDYHVATDRITGSPELYGLFGFPPGAVPTTDDIRARYAPGERARIQAEGFAALLRGERFVENEIQLIWPDGSTHWALLRAEALFDAAGRPARALGIVMDITERKRSEAALRAVEARLTLAKAAAGFGVWDWDRARGAIDWSPEVFDILGLADEGDRVPAFRSWSLALHPDDRARASAVIRAAVEAGQPFAVDFRLGPRRPDAADRWVRSQGAPVPGPGGALPRYVGINLDVTEQHRREERLIVLADDLREAAARAEREREHISDLSNDLFVAVGPAGAVTTHNRAWAALTGVNGWDLRGASFLDLLWSEDRREAEAALSAVRTGAPLGRFDARLIRSDEVVVWVAWTVTADAGTVYGVGRDVSIDKARDAALAQTQKMEALGQLTGGVAHDFNNLLQALGGYLELIRRQPGDAAKVARWADNAHLASERGTRLTEQLLAFSRSQRPQVAAVSLATVFAALTDMLQRTLGMAVTVQVSLASDDLAVVADRTQLEIALINLAVNARDAMPGGGRLTIAAHPSAPSTQGPLQPSKTIDITVTDTGSGMPADVAARAFDPFFTTKGIGKGTGLGLSQVYGMAQHAGGLATIESRPGVGTKVVLALRRAALPVNEARAEAGSVDVAAPAAATVLVVDDDAEVRSLLSDMLPALGYQATFVTQGRDALDAIARIAPDLVILDFAMPEMNGAEVAQAARRRYPGLKIIVASGYAHMAEIRQAIGPETTLLRKPFSMADLADALRTLLTVDPPVEDWTL